MPGIFFDQTAAADKDGRPWYERGFTEVEPVAPYANQSKANERTPEYHIKKNGTDPKEGYPKRQKKHKDAPGN